ncbi:MAG: FAD-binding oxidoreductase [Polyangiaceae bacterium]|nr:FAD-binding oxidoreductase [Polyangiaceae bacterium]MCW5792158.1 FAD-binding oxidoreductase [Polyangiaceae bacterium]
MPEAADVVVIGAGVMGLSVAYQLLRARRAGQRLHVVVVDQGYLAGGASGRNGGGVRAQWSTELNIELMRESLTLCAAFAREHRIHTWFRRGGYLFVAKEPAKVAMLEASAALQRRCGLATELLDASRAAELVPELDPEQIGRASYNPDDAVVFPWPFIWGYADSATRLGAEVHPFTEVIAVEHTGGRIDRVVTQRGSIRAPVVVNAAGAYSPQVATLAGVTLPNTPHRHEICASEPLKAWLTPLVADLDTGLYFSQSSRGELVGGVSDPRAPDDHDQGSSARFLALYSRALLRLCPRLERLKVLRQWAGLYDLTPDRNPIVGEVDEPSGFFQASGFMGHGFMMAPVIGKCLAQAILTGTPDPRLAPWHLRRFASGELLDEGMIIG